MVTLDSTVDQHTRVGLIGDPCQVKTALRTLKCTATLHGSPELGLSAVNWILSRLIAEEPDPTDFVARVDLLNRGKTSQRCRALACEAVNSLAPLCLPGTANFWQALVRGKEVWSDLRPNRSLTPLERFPSAETREVVGSLLTLISYLFSLVSHILPLIS